MKRDVILKKLACVLLLLCAVWITACTGDALNNEDGGKTETNETNLDQKEPNETNPDSCGKSHSFGEWVEILAPTCNTRGEKQRVCTVCGEIETGRVKMRSHEYGEWQVLAEPTCVTGGMDVRKCTLCDAENQRTVKALGHRFSDWKEIQSPACAKQGMRERECSVCDTAETEILPALGHSYNTDNFCTVCKNQVAPTEGMQFEKSSDGSGYVVTAYTGNAAQVVIPPYYDGCAVVGIGEAAFADRIGLVSITIPFAMRAIADGAFAGCRKLTEVINESSLSIKKGRSDHGGVAAYALTVHNTESKIATVGEYLFYLHGKIPYLVGYVGSETALMLPASYEGGTYRIGRYAFYGKSNISSVAIGDGVEEIGSHAFAGCAGLQRIVIPDGVTVIADNAFAGCATLASVTLGRLVSEIEKDAFLGCYLLTEVINRSPLQIKTGSSLYGFVAANAVVIQDEVSETE